MSLHRAQPGPERELALQGRTFLGSITLGLGALLAWCGGIAAMRMVLTGRLRADSGRPRAVLTIMVPIWTTGIGVTPALHLQARPGLASDPGAAAAAIEEVNLQQDIPGRMRASGIWSSRHRR